MLPPIAVSEILPPAAEDPPPPEPAVAELAPPLADLAPAASAARLAELFPALFGGAPKPLKLRIQPDIQQRAPGVFTRKALSVFLHRHTTSTAYLKALVRETNRFDLDGAPAGDVIDEHRQAAVAELERRQALHTARRDAERDAQRRAQEEARRARAADDEARRRRSELLRAFESTTLTPANFCALKGIARGELDELLAAARQDRERQAQAAREERPSAPPHPGSERHATRDEAPSRRPQRKPAGR